MRRLIADDVSLKVVFCISSASTILLLTSNVSRHTFRTGGVNEVNMSTFMVVDSNDSFTEEESGLV